MLYTIHVINHFNMYFFRNVFSFYKVEQKWENKLRHALTFKQYFIQIGLPRYELAEKRKRGFPWTISLEEFENKKKSIWKRIQAKPEEVRLSMSPYLDFNALLAPFLPADINQGNMDDINQGNMDDDYYWLNQLLGDDDPILP